MSTKKPESNFLNMVLVLFLVTLASAISLGYINELTKGPKAEARLKKKLEAIQAVIPAFSNNPAEEGVNMPVEGFKDSLEFYPGKNDGSLSGVAVSSFTEKGYSGLIKLMVGIGSDGNIHNVVVLEQKETPGLGTKIKDAKFKDQFIGKNPGEQVLEVDKDGGEIDAIAGATISSRAFCEATQRAYDGYLEHKKLFSVAPAVKDTTKVAVPVE